MATKGDATAIKNRDIVAKRMTPPANRRRAKTGAGMFGAELQGLRLVAEGAQRVTQRFEMSLVN